jgi:sugar O-acyltransferase (sialic acid O-acetyltransferase NeuD family)
MLPLVLIGAGGHAKVVLSLALALDRSVVGVCDPVLARNGVTHWRGLRVLGNDDDLATTSPEHFELVNGIGQLPRSTNVRQRVHERFKRQGFKFPVLVHPAAWVDPSAMLAAGAQIMAGAVLQADVTVGESSIVNTGARIDHDCRIGKHVHVAPGAVLCGGVEVGDFAFLAASCTLHPNIRIGEGALVASGAVVSRSLEAGGTYMPHRLVPTQLPHPS